MEKLFVPSAQNEMELVAQKNTISIPHESISVPKKLWINALSEVSLWLLNFHQKQQKKYRKIVERIKTESPTPIIEKKAASIQVSEELIEEILSKLKQFEKDCGYLDCNLDLSGLAKSLGTNHSYLSRIVNHVKGTSFKNYINNLRIEYAYVDLQTNPTKRRYTIEAISQEMGFKSAESFSKKFKQRYGLYPSVFLKKLNEAA
ncbi:MAG: helix-turn-helix domain-containing protein [Flavobacteriaceae bacterium]